MSLPLARLGDVELGWLADLPDAAEALARLHHGHWAKLMPDWSLDEATIELQDHATRRAFPTTWVARAGEQAVGSVSLVASDAAQFPQYTPWLSSLYVRPEFRGRGIGEALVGRLLFAARRWDFAAVHLFTEGPITLYRRVGFEVIENTRLFEQPVRILRRELA